MAFFSLSTFNWRHSPKSLSSAETDLVESTTVQQLAAQGGRDNKKADFRQFSPVVQTVNRSCQDCPDHVAIHK
jgi:hypothetical protein